MYIADLPIHSDVHSPGKLGREANLLPNIGSVVEAQLEQVGISTYNHFKMPAGNILSFPGHFYLV